MLQVATLFYNIYRYKLYVCTSLLRAGVSRSGGGRGGGGGAPPLWVITSTSENKEQLLTFLKINFYIFLRPDQIKTTLPLMPHILTFLFYL